MKEQSADQPLVVGWRDLAWDSYTPITLVIASQDRAQADRQAAATTNQFDRSHAVFTMRVRAELTSPDADIRAPPKPVQDVTPLSNIVWTWYVRPTRPGTAHLTLRAYNLVTDGGVTVEIAQPAFERDLQVKMTAAQKLEWSLGTQGKK